LAAVIGRRLGDLMPPGLAVPRLALAPGGNRILLRGSLALAAATALVEGSRYKQREHPPATETVAAAPALEDMTAEDGARHLLEAEESASRDLLAEAPAIGRVAVRIADALAAGGRVIYVGAGTSGRIGALDAVEVPCTFGLPEDRFVAVVAGGVADATLTIESEGEEDFSAVPELMLLQPDPRDVVVGLSASGTAFFVRSALAFARGRGAWTVMVHEGGQQGDFCVDDAIRLHSGPECVAGSTRMKAGTATKKVLNVLSTAAMARLGKVRRGHMIGVVATNEKLRRRAASILATLAGLDDSDAERRLAASGYRLRDALDAVEKPAPPSGLRAV
jgi:N-acetylmuramic acid 6-phosphate etherase